MRKCYIWIYFLICFTSCRTEVELKQGEYEQKMVVDGWIESGEFANVFLTLSSPFLTNYDSASISKTFLKYAKITLTCSNGESEILTLFRRDSYFPPFVYKSIRIKGIAGSTYHLKVEYKGQTITASTSIPEPPNLQDLRMIADSDSSGNLELSVLPSLSEKTRLFIQVKSKMADKNFHPSKIPLFQIPIGESIQIIHMERCAETNLYLTNNNSTVYKGWNRYAYSLNDTVLVKVGSVDMESYLVLKSIFADESVRSNPFAFNSAGIQTNIEGGIGRWTGIGLSPVQIYMKKIN